MSLEQFGIRDSDLPYLVIIAVITVVFGIKQLVSNYNQHRQAKRNRANLPDDIKRLLKE